MKTIFAAVLLGLCSACAQAAPPKPLLWKVSDADNHVYLLGSFHALRPDDYPLAPSVDAAIADAEKVVFEMSPAELRSPELPLKMAQALIRWRFVPAARPQFLRRALRAFRAVR